MPGMHDVLQNLRTKGYGSAPAAADSSDRVLELSDEEAKAIPPGKAGEEVCLSVYGVMSDDGFHVSRVEPENATDDQAKPEDVMGLYK